MTDLTIRPAEDADWLAIWAFFHTIVEEGRSIPYDPDLTSRSAQELWMERPPGRTVVCTEGAVVVGSAKMGANRPGRGGHVATATFMVDPGHQGRGVGGALGLHAVEWARAAGYHGMQFNAVVETNTRAVALWRSLGVRDRRHRPGSVRSPRPRARRPARDAPAPRPLKERGADHPLTRCHR